MSKKPLARTSTQSYDSNETGFHPRLACCTHNGLSICLILCHRPVPHLVS